jgi:hypothetical protein
MGIDIRKRRLGDHWSREGCARRKNENKSGPGWEQRTLERGGSEVFLGGLLLLPEGICFRCCCRPLGWRLPFYKQPLIFYSFFSFGFSFLFSLITSSLSFLSGPASSLYSLHAFRLTLVLMAPLVSLAGVVQQCKT